jgi:hypothetical protein
LNSREKTIRDREHEAERYREAANLALGQLEWCIKYLYRIRKDKLAARLDRNRSRIQEQVGLDG